MHPIIFLWSHPRSMSTATERIMRERGDLQCLHEPFLHYYYLQKKCKTLNEFTPIEGHPTSYRDTRDMILAMSEKSPVFAKDMSYYVIPELLDDIDFCRRVKHAFLIRNPLRSILSYYRLDPNLSQEEVGLQAQWLHFQGLKALGIDSLVIEAESIQSNTQSAISALWKWLGLDYCGHAFEWDDAAIPESWQYVKGWHDKASGSGGIRSVSADDKEKARDEFRRCAESAPFLNDYLAAHTESYQNLRQQSLEI